MPWFPASHPATPQALPLGSLPTHRPPAAVTTSVPLPTALTDAQWLGGGWALTP